MTTDRKQKLVVTAALNVWGVLWFGGWIAGGLLFPAHEIPTMLGAAVGWIAGFDGCGLVLWYGGIR